MGGGVVVIDMRRPQRIDAKPLRSRRRLRLRALLTQAQGGVCAHCEEPIPDTWEECAPDMPTIEHVVPRSLGGGHEIENLLIKHKACNEAGGNRPPSQRDRKWQAIVAAFLAARMAA